MAALPAEDLNKITWKLMQAWSKIWSECDFSKAELRAAVEDLDTWFDTNEVAANNSLSEPFRSNSTTSQKALLLIGVAVMRHGDEALLNAIIGGLG